MVEPEEHAMRLGEPNVVQARAAIVLSNIKALGRYVISRIKVAVACRAKKIDPFVVAVLGVARPIVSAPPVVTFGDLVSDDSPVCHVPIVKIYYK